MTELNSVILRDIGTLARTIHSKCDLRYKKYQLQKGQFIFLTRICENPGINQIQLSHIVRVDKTTTTKAVQKLISSGYLKKEKDGSDSRACKLYPTPKALDVYEMIIREENANLELCFRDFTPEERARACELVQRMSANLEPVWHEIKGQ